MLYVMSRENNLYELSYTMKRELQRRILSVVGLCVLIFAAITLFLRFVLFPVRQKSVSMEPDVVSGGWVLVSPIGKTPDRGDVVLLNPLNTYERTAGMGLMDTVVSFFTGQQIFPFSPVDGMGHSYVLRRVVGVPGDTLYMTGYVVFVKPAGSSHYLTEFEYSKSGYKVNITTTPEKWDGTLGVQSGFSEITLGSNEYFVLGDNRNSCIDSRLWGPVTTSGIRGKALVQYFPFRKFKLL